MAVKASAVITLSAVVDVSAVTRYYLLQSSTLARPSKPTTKSPAGGWTDTEPAYTSGSTNSLYFTDLTVFSDGTWSYSSVSLSSAYEAAKEAYNRATAAQTTANNASSAAASAQNSLVTFESEVTSRGTQLITNGTGLLGNNTNFSSWTYDPAVSNSSNGSFSRSSKNTIMSDEFIALTAGVKYRFEFDVKSLYGRATLYSMFVFYDADKNPIYAYNHMYRENTLTTLARELKNGDSVVYLTSAANWDVSTGTMGYRRGFIFWNYRNSKGYTFPENTYSRNVYHDLYTDANVDKTSNTIRLNGTWTRGTFPAGTKVSQSDDGATYKYIGAAGVVVPTSWTHYTGIMDGTADTTGKNAGGKFPPGVAYAKIGFLWNYNNADDTIWVTNLSVKQDYETSINAAQTAADNAQSSVDNLKVGGRNLIIACRMERGYLGGSGGLTAVSDSAYDMTSDYIPVKPGAQYAFSLQTDPNVRGWWRNAWYTSSKTYLSTFSSNSIAASAVPAEYSTVVTAPSNAAYARVSAESIRNGKCRIKFEQGSKATDWTPAPEDVDAGITTAQATADDAQEQTEANTRALQLLDGSVSGLSTQFNVFSSGVQAAIEEHDEILSAMTFDSSGLKVQMNGSIYYTLTDDIGYHIYQNDKEIASFSEGKGLMDRLQLGDIVARKTSKGGWVWTDA